MLVPEVLSGLRNSLAVKADNDTSKLLIAVGDVKVHLGYDQYAISSPTRAIHTLWVIFGPLVASVV